LIRQKPITAWQDVSFRHLPALEQYLVDYQSQKMLLAVVPVVILLVVFPISWLAGLTLLMTLPLIPLFMWLVGTGTAAIHRKHMLSLNRLGGFFADRISAQQTIRLFNQEEAQLNRFSNAGRLHNTKLAEVLRVAFLSSSVLDFFATVSVALVAVFIGFALLEEITIGFWGQTPTLQEGLFILLLAPAFFNEFRLLGKLYHAKAEATASADLWLHTLQWEPRPTATVAMSHRFKQLSLHQAKMHGFESDAKVLLTTQTLQLKENDRVLLTGPSGAGKTVLLDALAGLRSISGDITVNYHAVPNLQAILPSIFYLEQKPVFFDGSIRENLGLGRASDKQILNAIEQVGMSFWLNSLPDGLNSIWDESINLSGGEKQKLALTRVLIFDVDIVLLDEPFTHISEAEQASLTQVLADVTRDRASVWVSHRPVPEHLFSQRWIIDEQQCVQCRPNLQVAELCP
jgi:ATP-binding cassette subfamily C protein CydD